MRSELIEDLYPLSPLQEGMLFHALVAPDSGTYVEQMHGTLRGSLDGAAFRRAWQRVVDHYTVLRTAFFWEGLDEPCQVVVREVEVPWQELDWRSLSEAARRERLESFLEEDRKQGFELSEAPLLRLALIRLEEDTFEFVWTFHHLLIDGWSLPLLLRAVFHFYDGERSGQPAQLDSGRPFREYIAWLKRQDPARADNYWRRVLKGFDHTTPLPVEGWSTSLSGRPQALRESAGEAEGGFHRRHVAALSPEMSAALERLSRENHLTLSTIFRGAWALLLSRYSAERDVVFGATVSGRPADLPGVESMVGMFINTLPVRVQVSPEQPLLPWLTDLQKEQLELRQFEYSSLTQVKRSSDLPVSSPLFESIMVFENYPLEPGVATGESEADQGAENGGNGNHGGNGESPLELLAVGTREQNNFPLSLLVKPGQRISTALEYDPTRFGGTDVGRLLSHLEVLLEGVVDQPHQQTLGSLPLLRSEERFQLVVEWSDSAVAYDPKRCLHEAFFARAEQLPDAVALESDAGQWTAGTLARRAQALAWRLRGAGVGPEVVVGIYAERSAEMILGVLAVLDAGGAYLPLDPDYPADRLAFMVEDSEASVVLVQEALRESLPASSALVVSLDRTPEARIPSLPPQPAAGPEQLAYTIFTSGSTGRPKGVMVSHRAILNHLRWLQDILPLGPESVLLQKTPFGFDASVTEFFNPLSTGARLVLTQPGGHRDTAYLVEQMVRHRVSSLQVVPTLLEALLQEPAWAECTTLEQVICAGEVLKRSVQERFLAHPGRRLFNLYGPTEAAIDASWWRCRPDSLRPTVPIGRPIANLETHVLDAELRPVPVGMVGHLFLAGVGLARGYRGRPALTAERFVPHPLSKDPGDRMYRTGDLARRLSDGVLEFSGREDHQVKLRGVRIELEEIEAVLLRTGAYRSAAVLVREDVPGETRLVAYGVAADGEPPTVSELRRTLGAQLPDAMIPAHFAWLDALPTTPSGKADRRALARLSAPEGARPALEQAWAPPRNSIEERLVSIWSQVLRLDRVGVNDNYFELGGDSILSIRIVSRARQEGLRLQPRQLFEHQTVAELARVAEEDTGVAAVVDTEPVIGPVPLTPIQRFFFEQESPEPHHFNQALFFACRHPLAPGLLRRALAALLEHHDALRLRFEASAEGWQQVSEAPSGESPCHQVDLRALPEARRTQALEAAAGAFQISLDLAAGPLLRCGLFELGDGEPQRLLLTLHHLAVDGVSWRILMEDLGTAYLRAEAGEPIGLPPKTTSFKVWAERLEERARGAEAATEVEGWLERLAVPSRDLPLDFPGEAEARNTRRSARTVGATLSRPDTQALLLEIPSAYRTRINDLLLAALGQTLARFTGGKAPRIDLEGHGREDLFDDVDLSRTVGWFTCQFPLVLDLRGTDGPGDRIKAVKESLRSLPDNGVGYGILRYLASPELAEPLLDLPQAEVLFNYLGQVDAGESEDSPFAPAPESAGRAVSPLGLRTHQLEINGSVVGGCLQMLWTYSERLHRRSTIEALAEAFHNDLRALIEHCRSPQGFGYTPSDFPLVDLEQEALDRLLEGERKVQDVYPLSPMQEGMLFHALLEPEAGVYCEQFVVDLDGDLDFVAFERAWRAVVARHAVLRTSFRWQGLERPMQVVHREIELPLERADWRDLAPEEREQHLASWMEADRLQGFQISQVPLFRLQLFSTEGAGQRFVWSFHHLLIDGWCTSFLMKEIFALYEGYRRGEEVVLPPVRPYRDYIAWLAHQDHGRAEGYWRQALRGFSATTPLPADRRPILPEETGGSTAGPQQAVGLLDGDATTALTAFARRHRVTLNTIFQGTWALLLARYGGVSDVVFGTTVSGRPGEIEGVESMIGLFINTLPVRVPVAPEAVLVDWLADLQNRQVELGQFEYSRLVDIQAWSEVPSGSSLFESLAVFDNLPVDESMGEPASGEEELLVSGVALHERTHYPLTVVGFPGNRFGMRVEFDNQRLDTSTVQRMLGHWVNLLRAVPSDPERLLGRFDLLGEAERQQLLMEWNDTTAEIPAGLTVHGLFAERAAQVPDALAVVSEEGGLSYRELYRRADRLARYLVSVGVGPEVVVGVCLERSPESAVALLGVLEAGGAPLLLDPAYPEGRLTYMLEDSGAALLLTQETLEQRLGDSPRTLCLDTEWPRIDAGAEEFTSPLPQALPDHAAYVIYTSGSTGRPKGSLITHRSAAHYVAHMVEVFHLESEDRILQFASQGFDVVVEELFPTWARGAAAVLLPEETLADPRTLGETLARHRLSGLELPAAFWHEWVFEMERGGFTPPPSLRFAIVGCEKPSPDRLLAWRAFDVPMLIVFGLTETTVTNTVHWDRGRGDLDLPIGRPVANTSVQLLDTAGRPVPIGVPGQLFIGGVGLSRGYLGRPAWTAERFVPDVFGGRFGSEPGGRLYTTGDRAVLRADGRLDFLGRIDHQVSLRGFRVEPGEVERVLTQHGAVREAAVVAHGEASEPILVAFVVLAEGQGAGEALPAAVSQELRQHLERQLPSYMVPAAWVALEGLPTTANGKVDRNDLSSRPLPRGSERSSASARTPTAELLLGIWEEVLERTGVGVNDDFFVLGGHSLLATRILSRVREVLRVEMPLRLLFEQPTVAALSPRLEGLMGAGRALRPTIEPLGAEERSTVLPLSFAQQRLWFLDQLEGESSAYNMPLALRMRGALQPAVLDASLREVMRRHEVLRSRFVVVDGKPYQELLPTSSRKLHQVDLGALEAGRRDAEARRLATQEAHRPFDLARGPLLRSTLLELGDEHALLLTVHHSASDGWSMDVLLQETVALYGAFAAGQPSPLPELPIQYSDYGAWQRGWLTGEVLEAEVEHWRQQLAGSRAVLELPTDRPRPAVRSYQGARRTLEVGEAVLHGLRRLGRRHQATPFMTLLAAFQVLLARISRQGDFNIGVPVAGRNQLELEGLIGFFVNTLVLRADLSSQEGTGKLPFPALLERVRETTLDGHAHQDLPFEKLVDELRLERHLSLTPLFQVLFDLENAPTGEAVSADIELSSQPFDGVVAKFDLALALYDQGESLAGQLDYSTDLFDATTAERLAGSFRRLLEALAAQPEASVWDLPLLSAGEQQQLLAEWNATHTSFSEEHGLHHVIERQAAQEPGAVAVVYGGEARTYGELNEAANRLAHHLRELGVTPTDQAPVGILLERSHHLMTALLGILKAGGAYLPLETSLPTQRLAVMIEDAQMQVLLTSGPLPEGLEVHHVVDLERDREQIAAYPAQDPVLLGSPDDLAYVIYTSGSTGRPKGVMNSHRAILNRLQWMQAAYGLGPDDRVLQKTPSSFDVSVWEFFWPLMVGARLVLARPDGHRDPAYLLRLIAEEGITTLHFVPSMLQVFLAEEGVGESGGSLRRVIASGEALPWELWQRFRQSGLKAGLHNLYGPTEAAVDVTSWACGSESGSSVARPTVPIGRPISNLRIHLLDPQLTPVPIGATGELHIGGVGLARGYLARPALTATAFLPDPRGQHPGDRLYRTGDLARHLPGGEIEFLGRVDHQVKIRGLRIELQEIEAALLDLPSLREAGVREAVVLARRDRGTGGTPGDGRLVAYLTGDGEEKIPPVGELRTALGERLPDYMVPSAFVFRETLPQTTSGKVDRRALLAEALPERGQRGAGQDFVAPSGPVEKKLARIWAELLRLGEVGARDNFFELGGDSILSIQIVARARKSGLRLTPRQIFEHQTIAELAAVAESAEALVIDQGPVVGEVRSTPIQEHFYALGSPVPHHYNQSLLFEVPAELRGDLLERVVAALLEHHDALRLRFEPQESEAGGAQWRAVSKPPGGPTPFTRIDLSALPQERHVESVEWAAAAVQGSLNLEAGPLLRAVQWHLAADLPGRLALVAHHLVIDGVSWRVLLQDLTSGYGALEAGGAVRFEPKTTSFRDWAAPPAPQGPRVGPGRAAVLDRREPASELLPAPGLSPGGHGSDLGTHRHRRPRRRHHGGAPAGSARRLPHPNQRRSAHRHGLGPGPFHGSAFRDPRSRRARPGRPGGRCGSFPHCGLVHHPLPGPSPTAAVRSRGGGVSQGGEGTSAWRSEERVGIRRPALPPSRPGCTGVPGRSALVGCGVQLLGTARPGLGWRLSPAVGGGVGWPTPRPPESAQPRLGGGCQRGCGALAHGLRVQRGTASSFHH